LYNSLKVSAAASLAAFAHRVAAAVDHTPPRGKRFAGRAAQQQAHQQHATKQKEPDPRSLLCDLIWHQQAVTVCARAACQFLQQIGQ
jgi:hypothetical protein